MKKALLLIALITVLSSVSFTGCGAKNAPTTDDGNGTVTKQQENPAHDKNKPDNGENGFEVVPRDTDERSQEGEDKSGNEAPDDNKPVPKKHRKPKPRYELPDAEIFIIRLGRGHRHPDKFKPDLPIEPDPEPTDPPDEETEPNG